MTFSNEFLIVLFDNNYFSILNSNQIQLILFMRQQNEFLDPETLPAPHSSFHSEMKGLLQPKKYKSKSTYKLQKITESISNNPFQPQPKQNHQPNKRLQTVGRYIVQQRHNTSRLESDTNSVKNLRSVRGSIHSDIYGKVNYQPKVIKQRTIATEGSELAQRKKLNLYIVDQYKKQKLVRDFQQHPSKYKIVAQHLGLTPSQTYNLNTAQITRIHEEYQKKKGLEYLRQGQSLDRIRIRQSRSKNTVMQKPVYKTPERSRQYIHKIFGHLVKSKKCKSFKTFKEVDTTKKGKLQQIYEKQQMLGKLVFQRAKKHLKQKREGVDFIKRVNTEEAVDDALINFVKTKIKRVEMCLNH